MLRARLLFTALRRASAPLSAHSVGYVGVSERVREFVVTMIDIVNDDDREGDTTA